jgi:hypothetical protein
MHVRYLGLPTYSRNAGTVLWRMELSILNIDLAAKEIAAFGRLFFLIGLHVDVASWHGTDMVRCPL